MTPLVHSKQTIGSKLAVHIVFLCVFCAFSFALLIKQYQEQKQQLFNNYSLGVKSKVEASLGVYKKFSNFIYQQIINNDEVMKLFQQAANSDGAIREENRQKVLDILNPTYRLLVKQNFRQLHFHFANGDTFLRVHKPAVYGDNLFSVRESVRLANLEQRIIKGFEEGRTFNGYRFVYPVIYGGEHLGSVEVSLSMGSILDVLYELYLDKDFYFIIKKSAVEKKVFNDAKTNYISSSLSEDYYYDKGVFEQNVIRVKDRTLVKNVALLRKKLKGSIDRMVSFTKVVSIDGVDYALRFYSIKNFKNEHVAYLIVTSKDASFNQLFNKFLIYGILLLLVVITYLWSVYSDFFHKTQLLSLSNTDFLTKLYNRKKFTEMLHLEILKYNPEQSVFSVIIFDIDHFKCINDELGHNVGDEYLKELSKLVSANVRDTDIFARWGGEEFVLLLPNTQEGDALTIAEKLRKKVEAHQFSSSKHVTISLGVAACIAQEQKTDDIIARADKALYAAKSDGRNTSRAWSHL